MGIGPPNRVAFPACFPRKPSKKGPGTLQKKTQPPRDEVRLCVSGMWVQIKPPRGHRFRSMLLLTRVPFRVPIFNPQPCGFPVKLPQKNIEKAP